VTTGTGPSLFERVAQVVHEANRTWDAVRGVVPGAPWDQAQDWKRSTAVEGVKLALAGAEPPELHEAWRAAKLAQGWTPGAVKDPQAKTDPMLVPYQDLSDEQMRTPDLVAAITRALACGHDRWDVKTLSDPAASQVKPTAQSATVAQLIALPAPLLPTSRVAEEFNTYELSGTITFAKLEGDSDIHMVLADDAGQTMILEAVCPGCAPNSIVGAQIAAVRKAVEAQFPTAAAGGTDTVAVPVTVTGVAFFDHLHGQTGVAPNGIELHPVLSFNVGGTPAPPSPAVAPPRP
jgi:hypothetical protein